METTTKSSLSKNIADATEMEEKEAGILWTFQTRTATDTLHMKNVKDSSLENKKKT